MFSFTSFIDYLRYREAVRKADKAHAESGERYYVMPTIGDKGKPALVILDRFNFRKLKKKHYIPHVASVRDLTNECVYLTPYRDGTGFLTKEAMAVKRQQYYSFCKAQRSIMKMKKGIA